MFHEEVDARNAAIIFWLVILFVCGGLPCLCLGCMECAGGNRHPNGVMEDGVPRGSGYEWDRYQFLTSAKRKEVDEARKEMLGRCIGWVSMKLEGAHMLRLGEGSLVDEGEHDIDVEADIGGGGCVNAKSAAEKRGSLVGRRVLSERNVSNPDDYIYSKDGDEEASKSSSLSLTSPNDRINRIDNGDPATAEADEEVSSTQKEDIIQKGNKGATQDLVESEGATQNLTMASNHSLVSLREYTHICIPYPGYCRDGTKVEERMPNWRFSFFKKKVQVADEAPAEQDSDTKEVGEGKVEEGGEKDSNDSPKSDVRNKNECRNVPAFCAICLGEYSPAEVISWSSNPACTHVFHKECIVKWLVTLGKRSRNHDQHVQVDGWGIEEGMEALAYKLECPCCRQEFVWKASVLLGESEAAGEDVGTDASGDENV